ncbi:hypothetical protein B0H16DRAFT_1858134 [Mycena metata]|uniref:Uncharacterized protein n=1 Tax=Mycena metata TaxID=1033252 RepID=A0AAD7IK90_9AGAR|nr:hypothetical protein B0H16DRAFT_1858134 [Mycena metata]
MGQTSGATLQEMTVLLNRQLSTKRKPGPVDPSILVPFTALSKLTWTTWGQYGQLCFANSPPKFSALENLQTLMVRGGSPSLLDISLKLPLNSLQDVDLSDSDNIQASVPFLRAHGGKLIRLKAQIDLLVESKVFDLCKNLHTLVVDHPSINSTPERRHLPDDFISSVAPHTVLAKICFCTTRIEHEAPIKNNLEQLKSENFPALKEIQYHFVKWPIHEHQVRNNKWIALSEVLRPKGIKLIDQHGVGGTRPGRNLGSDDCRAKRQAEWSNIFDFRIQLGSRQLFKSAIQQQDPSAVVFGAGPAQSAVTGWGRALGDPYRTVYGYGRKNYGFYGQTPARNRNRKEFPRGSYVIATVNQSLLVTGNSQESLKFSPSWALAIMTSGV